MILNGYAVHAIGKRITKGEKNMVEVEQSLLNIPQSEHLKLSKMSKGYNWEIKLLNVDIDKLEQLNNEMIKRFEMGGKKDNEDNFADI